MKGFRLLSYAEEKQLTNEQKIEYYNELRDFLAQYPDKKSKKFIYLLQQGLNSPIKHLLSKFKGYDLTIENAELVPDEPVIFATTHQNFLDHFNLILALPKNGYILNNVNISLISKILLNLNGVIFVDRNDPASRYNSKVSMMNLISKGKSVVVFPEGTYNASPNKLVLPIHSGVIDIARKMQVPIVPFAQEYEYDTNGKKAKVKSCAIRFGRPITVDYDDNTREKTEELRDELATLRFEMISKKGVFKRQDLSSDEYRKQLESQLATIESQGMTYEEEESTIQGYSDEFYRHFPINAVSLENESQSPSKKL